MLHISSYTARELGFVEFVPEGLVVELTPEFVPGVALIARKLIVATMRTTIIPKAKAVVPSPFLGGPFTPKPLACAFLDLDIRLLTRTA
jgi:hypothetical protein